MLQEIQFILYNLPEKEGKVQVIIRDETLWCTQKAMAQLSYSRIQYVQNLHILPRMARYITHNFIILMLLSRLVIV